MGRNPYIFVPAERVRRARRGTEGAHRAPQTLPRPDRLLILPTPSTHRHTALSPPTAASSFPPSLSPSLGKRSGGQQSRRAASLSLALAFCFFPPWPYTIPGCDVWTLYSCMVRLVVPAEPGASVLGVCVS